MKLVKGTVKRLMTPVWWQKPHGGSALQGELPLECVLVELREDADLVDVISSEVLGTKFP